MTDINYDWIRFWAPRDAQINYEDGGFLIDPVKNYFLETLNPELITLEDVTNKHCVVLLGEPGSGKTTELNQFIVKTKETGSAVNASFLEINLNNFSTDALFVEEVFKSETFISWQSNNTNLYLFMDSLDEGMLTISKISNTISNHLHKLDHNRLYIRLACRTLDWPKSLEETFDAFWEENDVSVIEIAPLRKKDITIALTQNGIDPKPFIDEIIEKEIVPLANKPLTLSLLIRFYKQDKCFPQSKRKLYELGCNLLCDRTQF